MEVSGNVAKYVLSTKKRRMLVLSDRLFYYNKVSTTTDSAGRIRKKTYWKCSSKKCGACAFTVVDDADNEIEVMQTRDHDYSICVANQDTAAKRDRRQQVVVDNGEDEQSLDDLYDAHPPTSLQSQQSIQAAAVVRRRKSTTSNTQVKRSEIVVLKLGGSAITDKARLETLRADNLAATCRQIKEVYQDVGSRVIVVHGAGSFGHHQAKQFSLKTGGDDATWLSGLTQTRASVLRLNTKVSEGLAEAGVPVASASPFSFMQMSDGCILKNSFVDHIVNLLAVGIVPISHGDVVLDKKRKCGILSGDRIMDLLCSHESKARPAVAVFLTDVAGVYSCSPSDPAAVLVPRIAVRRDGSYTVPTFGAAVHPDVTGGMKGKVEEAARIALKGIKVHIVEVGTVHAMAAMRGLQPAIGTTVVLEEEFELQPAVGMTAMRGVKSARVVVLDEERFDDIIAP